MVLRNLNVKTFFESTKNLKSCEFIIPIVENPLITIKEQVLMLENVSAQIPNSYVLEPLPKFILDNSTINSVINSITKQLPYYGHKLSTKIHCLEVNELKLIGGLTNKRKNKENKFVIICVDPIEQHSFHLPLGTDIMISESLSSYLTKRYKNTTSVVSMNYTLLRWALGMGSSISINITTFKKLLSRYLNFTKAFFDKTIIISTHMAKNHKIAIDSIVAKQKHKVIYLSPLQYTNFYNRDHHAGVLETSIMLHIRPETVKLNNFIGNKTETLSFEEISELTNLKLPTFINKARKRNWNGIVSNEKSLITKKIVKGDKLYLQEKGEYFWKKIVSTSKNILEGFLYEK